LNNRVFTHQAPFFSRGKLWPSQYEGLFDDDQKYLSRYKRAKANDEDGRLIILSWIVPVSTAG
jgi:hypothetical protein